jgi:hypothetical protein
MRIRMSAMIAALSLLLTGVGFAQQTTGTLTGRLVDAQGLAVPGATVTVTGPQGARSFVSDSEGRFSAPFLVPGTYDVRAELQGFKAFERRGVVVGLGQTVDLPIAMQVGGLTETVEVSAASPVIDTRTTATGGVLDPETLQRLPVGRNITDALYVLPGVSDSSGAGQANPSIAGASGLENNYIVDGVNITDTGFGGFGAFNTTYLSLGMGVTSDFVKETQVKTAGFEAEFGESTGGVVNVVTKSGSNEFSGSAFGYTRPGQLEADWKELVTPNGTVNTTGTMQSDFGISLGGAAIQNRLFFFGTYNPQWQTRTFIAPEGFPFRSLGDVNRQRRIHSYAGKVTAQASSSHRFDFSVFGDPSKGDVGLQNPTGLRRVANPGVPGTADITGAYSELDYGGHNQTLRYDGIVSSNFLLEGAIAHASNKFNETPNLNEWAYSDLRTVPQGRTGGLGFFENNDGSNTQYSLKATNILRAGGQHQLRYGVQVQDINFLRGTNYSGPGLRLASGQTTITGGPIQIRAGADGVTYYRATRGLLLAPGRTNQLYTSMFIQDTWQAGRLTVTPGVRWDRQYLEGPEPGGDANYPALCYEDDSRPGAGDGSGNPIACNYTWSKNWAPRIGATYDVTGRGSSKVYASWGRFYAKVPNDLAVRAMGTDSGITRQDYFDAALTRPVANGVSLGGTTTHLQRTSDHAAIIEPGTGGAYTDEFLAGFEFEAFPSTSVGIRYIRRTMPQILEDIGQLPVAGYFEDEVPVDYFITNPDSHTTVVQCCGATNVSFEDPVHDYDAVEVVLNRRFSGRWGAIASYRFSRLRGNFEGFFRSDNGQNDPAISSLYDFPTNDPTYTAVGGPELGFIGDIRYQGATLGAGRLPNDRPHQVKLFTSYLLGDVNIGVGFTTGSGKVLTGLAANPVYNNAGEIPLTVRGEGFETVDGFKKRAPMDAQVDLHLDYRPTIAGQRLTFVGDIFNLFNRRAALNYDNWYETAFGTLNPNYGYPTNGGGSSQPSYQAPFGVRLGVRFDW